MSHQRMQQTVRRWLLEDVLQFVRTAVPLPGIVRIALLGSIVTEKSDPKDVDLLSTVTDEADLIPLATAARRLKGHAQSYHHRVDVFVADPREERRHIKGGLALQHVLDRAG